MIMLSSDPFEKYASYYSLTPHDDRSRREFFRILIDKHKISTILDCACGTGDDLILLNSLGVDIWGSDISDAMLAEARRKLGMGGIDIPLNRVDFRELHRHFEQSFDAILCLTTSLPQLGGETEIKKALSSMRAILSPQGIIVISQGMTDRQFHSRERFFPIINTENHTRIMVVDYYEKEWEAHVLDLFRSGEKTDFQIYSFRYLTLLEDDYIRLLKETGFDTIDIYGGFCFDKYDKEKSNGLVIVARR